MSTLGLSTPTSVNVAERGAGTVPTERWRSNRHSLVVVTRLRSRCRRRHEMSGFVPLRQDEVVGAVGLGHPAGERHVGDDVAGKGAALHDVVVEVRLADVVLLGDRVGGVIVGPVGSSILVPVANTVSVCECTQLGSQAGSSADPTSSCTTGSPVKLRSFDRAMCWFANFDIQSLMVGPSTTVFPSISNLVRPSSAAFVGDAPKAITTGTAIAATRTKRRWLDFSFPAGSIDPQCSLPVDCPRRCASRSDGITPTSVMDLVRFDGPHTSSLPLSVPSEITIAPQNQPRPRPQQPDRRFRRTPLILRFVDARHGQGSTW